MQRLRGLILFGVKGKPVAIGENIGSAVYCLLTMNSAPESPSHNASTLSRRIKLLALGPQEPWPATDGGKEGIHGALQALAQRADVTFACPGQPADASMAAHYRDIGVDYRPVGFTPRETLGVVLSATLQLKPFKFHKYGTAAAERSFDAAIGDVRPDAILCFHAHMEQLGQRLKRLRGWNGPVLVREHNIEYELVAGYRASMRPLARALAAPIEWLTRRAERDIWHRADLVAFLSDRDFATARASGVNGHMMLAPEGVPIPPRRAAQPPSGAPRLLIPLNRKAPQSVANLRLFLHDYWAQVAGRAELAEFGLAITGVDAAQLAELCDVPVAQQPLLRVEALGFLDELAPAFARSLALIAPTFIGGGIRKKILEGMAHQIPVIATDLDIGTCSYFTAGDNILSLGTPDEFAATLLRLRSDAQLWHRLSNNGRASVEKHATWSSFADALLEAVTPLLMSHVRPTDGQMAGRLKEAATS
jgi:glycosyltransferase involved in cell wall biosynthesis